MLAASFWLAHTHAHTRTHAHAHSPQVYTHKKGVKELTKLVTCQHLSQHTYDVLLLLLLRVWFHC